MTKSTVQQHTGKASKPWWRDALLQRPSYWTSSIKDPNPSLQCSYAAKQQPVKSYLGKPLYFFVGGQGCDNSTHTKQQQLLLCKKHQLQCGTRGGGQYAKGNC